MKLADALTKYRDYRADLIEQQKSLSARIKIAEDKAKSTGDSAWSDEAATLQLSLNEANKKFEDNQEVLDNLTEQYCAAWNLEVARQQADPENGMAATMGKILTTVARMCAGDKVPYNDEKKVMDFDSDMYMKAKMAQTTMAAMKKRQKEYDTLWDDEEGEKYDPEAAADNTEAAGNLPEIPQGEDVEMVVS